MKKHLLLAVTISLVSISQGYAQNFLPYKPKALELSKYQPVSGKMELRHITDNPKVNLPINFSTAELKNLSSKVLESDLSKISCDGDFALLYDVRGYPFIQVNTIKTCINEQGLVIAHSIGMPVLSKEKISASVRLIEESHVAAKPNPAVNQTSAPKEKANPNAGVILIPGSTGTSK
ncbi:MAG: hypothetical protein WC635_11735 [Bacteriovorax sp.]|jgi:hypothetical protein